MDIEVRLKPTSNIAQHYDKVRFILSGLNGQMMNIKYKKFGVWASITVHERDIEIIGHTDVFE